MTPKKLYIKTYGCQMNVYDSIKMADMLKPLGFETSETPDGADMVILNTCHIREKATEKVFSDLGRIRPYKEQSREDKQHPMVIAVAGCTAQAEGEEIFNRAPYVDIVVGPQSYHTLPELITKVMRQGGQALNLDFEPNPKFDALAEECAPQGVSAFLSIQEGCDKFCTFCVVPYTRGAEFSRPVSDIYREAVKLVAFGAKEITLLGQNVNAYHGEGPEKEPWSLAQLIAHIAPLKGLERIRYTTSHPRDMTDDLIQAHGEIETLMPFIHLPVQAGSNRILQAMNRKHTREEYLRIIEKLRKSRPNIAFSSDFIVGFPGETEADFEQTLSIVKEVGFAQSYSFKYSPRPGTPAALQGQIPEEVKEERLSRLQAVISHEQRQFNEACVGTTMSVLFDRKGKYEQQIIGRSPYMQSVHVMNAPLSMHSLCEVRITEAFQNSLACELVTSK